MRSRAWVGQYVIAMFLALLLGVILSSVSPFKQTTLGATKLRASQVVEFMAYGGALAFFWLLGRRATVELGRDQKGLAFLSQIATPLSTLIVVSAAHEVLLLIVSPFLSRAGTTVYSWIFVVVIASAAVWFILALFRHSPLLIESIQAAGQPRAPEPGQPHGSVRAKHPDLR